MALLMKIKFLLILIALTLSSQIWAQKHIVLDLENILVQRIPRKMFETAKIKNQLINTDNGYYYIHLGTKELIQRLLNRPDIVLSIAYSSDSTTTNKILNAIIPDMAKKITDGLGSFITKDSSATYNLKQITTDLSHLVFVTLNPRMVKEDQKSSMLLAGENYYKYETFADAQSMPASPNVPATEIEWLKTAKRAALLANLFKLKKLNIDASALKAKLDTDIVKSVEYGEKLLAGKSQDLQWSGNTCEGFDYINEKTLMKMSLQECLKVLPHKVAWTDINRLNCAYFSEELKLIDHANSVLCTDTYVLKDPGSGTLEVVKSFPGMESMTLDQIFEYTKGSTYTFKSALRASAPSKIQNALPPSCLRAIKQVYANGNSFSSNEVKMRTNDIAHTHVVSGVKDNIFYHWSKNTSIYDVISKNKPAKIFNYLRNKDYSYWWLYMFYVAEDPESSHSFGNILMKVTMRPSVRIYSEFSVSDPVSSREAVFSEILRKYPDTQACMTSEIVENLDLYFLAIEDTGADMIQYWNSWGRVYSRGGNDYQFFQVLNPASVVKLELGK